MGPHSTDAKGTAAGERLCPEWHVHNGCKTILGIVVLWPGAVRDAAPSTTPNTAEWLCSALTCSRSTETQRQHTDASS